MAKAHTLFICQQCSYESARWLGKCPSCGSWNSLVETVAREESSSSSSSKIYSNVKPQNLSQIKLSKNPKTLTKVKELDRALGGGVVPGQVTLIAGIPGIGKSTLLLQIANNMGKVLYVSGEESVSQLALRASRLGIKNKDLNILETTDVDEALFAAEKLTGLDMLIIDSIQTMATSDLSGMAGSVGQVRECAFRLVKFAKSKNIPIFMVGHVTKEGGVAGPALLAHIVDTVLWFEGDKSLTLRMIKATKNRFGPSVEVGVFEMQESGLKSLTNPEKLFLSGDQKPAPGRVSSAIIQGTRPILIEIESLVVKSKLAFPRQVAQGVDQKRFEIIIAILTRRCGIPLYDYDCFVSVAGGITARDPAVDLAICLSLASSFFDKPVSSKFLAVGEVGLLGEIRMISGAEKISKLAQAFGYAQIIQKYKNLSVGQVIHNIFLEQKSPQNRP